MSTIASCLKTVWESPECKWSSSALSGCSETRLSVYQLQTSGEFFPDRSQASTAAEGKFLNFGIMQEDWSKAPRATFPKTFSNSATAPLLPTGTCFLHWFLSAFHTVPTKNMPLLKGLQTVEQKNRIHPFFWHILDQGNSKCGRWSLKYDITQFYKCIPYKCTNLPIARCVAYWIEIL